MTAPRAPLVATDVTVTRAGRDIVRGVSMEGRPGQMCAVTGPSGSGKTTLLSVLAGITSADAGAVAFDGRPVRRADPAHVLRTGLVLQLYGLVSVLTSAENVEIVLQARGCPADVVEQRARRALERVRLADTMDQLAERLSGGQQQRIAVARALVGEPALLIADEPTSELDADNRNHVLAELRAEADRGVVVVIATHDPEVAARCDAEVHLVDGAVSSPLLRDLEL